VIFALLGWGMLVGLDLVSVPQMMIARPLVAGPIAGAMLGDVATGLQLGVLFELFQYDVLPVGAVRYPEYGPATVAAVAAAHLTGGLIGIGVGAGVGLVVGMLGGISLHLLRILNARAVARAADQLEAGAVDALVRVHAASIARDAVRAALVTGVGLGFAWLVGPVLSITLLARELRPETIRLPGAAVAGAALATGSAGVLRLVGKGPLVRWLATGVAAGAIVAWLR